MKYNISLSRFIRPLCASCLTKAMADELNGLRKAFHSWVAYHNTDERTKALKRKYDAIPYGHQANRLKFLKEWDHARSKRKRVASPSGATIAPSPRTSNSLNFNSTGFRGGLTMRCATTSLSTRISIVECPNRAGTNILKGVGAEVAKRISLRTDVYVSSSELAPARPLLLVYGEDRSTEELRSKFNLKQDDVFIFGNTKNGAGDEACGWFPFSDAFFLRWLRLVCSSSSGASSSVACVGLETMLGRFLEYAGFRTPAMLSHGGHVRNRKMCRAERKSVLDPGSS